MAGLAAFDDGEIPMRTSQQVAKRVLAMGCLAFRGSLEATEHQRSAGISSNLLPWLRNNGIDDELDFIERAILEAPYHRLREDQEVDANWSGEAAWIFAWALGILQRPPARKFVDYRVLVEQLQILRGDATAFVASASLRPHVELGAFCVETLTIRLELQKLRISDEPTHVLDQLLDKRLAAIGLARTAASDEFAAQFVKGLADDERRQVAGLYFVRDHAATWLFDDRPSYFASSLPE